MKSNLRVALYARCSTVRDQSPEAQLSELNSYATARGFQIAEVISDTGYSGTTEKRPGLTRLLRLVKARKIDAVIVVKLDRLFRSLKHLVTTLNDFDELGVLFVSTRDQIDLTTSSGRLLVNILGSFAEFEADIIRERTLLGIEYARRCGKRLGRPPVSPTVIKSILQLRHEGAPYHQIQKRLGVSKGLISSVINGARKTLSAAPEVAQGKTVGCETVTPCPYNGRKTGIADEQI